MGATLGKTFHGYIIFHIYCIQLLLQPSPLLLSILLPFTLPPSAINTATIDTVLRSTLYCHQHKCHTHNCPRLYSAFVLALGAFSFARKYGRQIKPQIQTICGKTLHNNQCIETEFGNERSRNRRTSMEIEALYLPQNRFALRRTISLLLQSGVF